MESGRESLRRSHGGWIRSRRVAPESLALEAQAGGEVVDTGLGAALEHVNGVALAGELDAHAAGELVAGDHGVNEITFGRPAHAAARGVHALVP